MDWPYTSEEWFWTTMFAALVVGAAGGWAYLIARIVEHVRYRREERLPWDDPAAVPVGDWRAEIRRIEGQGDWYVETIKERHGG
jgi:hypothetical protein